MSAPRFGGGGEGGGAGAVHRMEWRGKVAWRTPGLGPAVLLAFLAAVPAWSQAPSNARMLSVLEKVVKEKGLPITATGSFLTGDKFKDPLTGGTSDFDMTLRMPGDVSDAEAAKKWREMKQVLEAEIRKEFSPAEANKILARTNLYPPDQLMPPGSIQTQRQAAGQFRKLNAVPSLDPALNSYHAGSDVLNLTPDQWKAASEGLYGEGGAEFRKVYDHKAGRTFVAMPDANGKVEVIRVKNPGPFSGAWAELTPEGRGGLITQLNHKTLDLLAEGDERAAMKNIARMLDEHAAFQRELGIDLGGDAKLKGMLSKGQPLTGDESKLLRKRILEMEIQNQFMLRQAGDPDLLRKIAKSPAWQRMMDAGIGALDTIDKLQKFMMVFEVANIARGYVKGDDDAFAKGLYKFALSLGAGTPAAMAEIADLAMELTKALGVGLANKHLDVLDFLQGLGRDHVRDQTTISDARDLLRLWPTEAAFLAAVEARARDAHPFDTPVDKMQRELWAERSLALYRKVVKDVAKQWWDLVDIAEGQGYQLSVSGAEPVTARRFRVTVPNEEGRATVTARVRGMRLDAGYLTAEFDRLAAFDPARLGPDREGGKVRVYYEWIVNGRSIERFRSEPHLTVRGLAPGEHTILARVHYSYLPKETWFFLKHDGFAAATVTVAAGEEAEEPTGQVAGEGAGSRGEPPTHPGGVPGGPAPAPTAEMGSGETSGGPRAAADAGGDPATGGSPMAGASGDTGKTASSGAWVMVETRAHKADDARGEGSWRCKGTAGDGSANLVEIANRGEQTCSYSASWTSPPTKLVPGETVAFSGSLRMSSSSPEGEGYYLGAYLGLAWERPDIAIGYASGSSVSIVEGVSVSSREGPRQASGAGQFAVPGGAAGARMMIRAGLSAGTASRVAAMDYIYEFQSDPPDAPPRPGMAGQPPPAWSAPPVPPDQMRAALADLHGGAGTSGEAGGGSAMAPAVGAVPGLEDIEAEARAEAAAEVIRQLQNAAVGEVNAERRAAIAAENERRAALARRAAAQEAQRRALEVAQRRALEELFRKSLSKPEPRKSESRGSGSSSKTKCDK